MANDIWRLDLAERLEIGRLIRRLDRPERIAWLVWCCQQVSFQGHQIMLTTEDGPATERWTWEMFKGLCTLHNLDVKASRANLESRVRKTGTPLFFGAQ